MTLSPATASVAKALVVHAQGLLGAGIGLVIVALVIAVSSRRSEARTAALGLAALGAVQAALGGVALWYAPLYASPPVLSLQQRGALWASAQHWALAALATFALLALLGLRRSKRQAIRGASFALGVGALALAAQALAIEGTVRSNLGALQREAALRATEARVAAYCARHCEAGPQIPMREEALSAQAEADADLELGVQRVYVTNGAGNELPSYGCLASGEEVWCAPYGLDQTSVLEKLVRDHGFASWARTLSDEQLVDWVAFALVVNVWRPEHARAGTRSRAAPPRVDRGPTRLSIDFWEWHPLGVLRSRLRHAVVTLEGNGVHVQRGPMSEPIGPP